MSRTDGRERKTEDARDDLFWHEIVEDIGLGPKSDALVEEAGDGRAGWGRTLAYVGSVLLGACVFVGATEALRVASEQFSGGDDAFSFWLTCAHILVVAVLLVMIASAAPVASPKVPVARRAWRQFKRGWTWLWAGWLALYGWLAVKFGVDGGATWDMTASCVADVLNIASSFVFFYLFLVLDKPSVRVVGLPERDREFRRSLNTVMVVAATVALLSVLGRVGLFRLEWEGPLLGSVFSAVGMAFFVGRLSDSHMKVRRALLAPLYLYVAIQMFWHLFVAVGPAGEAGFGIVLGLALILKVYLFAVITRWMGDGKLQTYFDEVAFPRVPADLE